MSEFGDDYDKLVEQRRTEAASGCCDCGDTGPNSAYTRIRDGNICRKCYTDRCNNRQNPKFGDTSP